MKIVKGNIKANLYEAAKIIQNGGLVAFPTETVYGLGADALNPKAVARIFEVKNRPRFDPLIVHIADEHDLQRLCTAVDDRASKLMQRFWPGPLTLVLPKTPLVPDIVTAGLDTVAVRMPNHSIALNLIREAGTPIAAPSANPFGYLSPTTAEHVMAQLGDKVDMILDGGKCSIGIESTIIDLSGERPILLRTGGLAIEEIEPIIGKVVIAAESPDKPLSPGQLPRHYSPQTLLKIIKDREFNIPAQKRVGLLAFKHYPQDGAYEMVEVLSPRGDLQDAAANFFSCLHRLDKAGLDVIYAEPVPEVGLGRAIMERLIKAASREKAEQHILE